jgi:hypothetical protein
MVNELLPDYVKPQSRNLLTTLILSSCDWLLMASLGTMLLVWAILFRREPSVRL